MNLKTILILAIALTAPAFAENTLNYNLVEFNESATVTVPNDTMHITLVIQENGKIRETISNTVTRKLNALQTKIRGNKQFVAELGNRSVYPQYNDKQQITGWQDRVEMHIKSTDFNALSQLVAETQSFAMLDGISFSVSPDKRAKAVEQASEQALKAFQKRAEFVSRSLGFSGYKLVKVDLNNRFESAREAYAAPMMMSAKRNMAVSASMMDMSAENAGEQSIQQNLNVTIQMQ